MAEAVVDEVVDEAVDEAVVDEAVDEAVVDEAVDESVDEAVDEAVVDESVDEAVDEAVVDPWSRLDLQILSKMHTLALAVRQNFLLVLSQVILLASVILSRQTESLSA